MNRYIAALPEELTVSQHTFLFAVTGAHEACHARLVEAFFNLHGFSGPEVMIQVIECDEPCGAELKFLPFDPISPSCICAKAYHGIAPLVTQKAAVFFISPGEIECGRRTFLEDDPGWLIRPGRALALFASCSAPVPMRAGIVIVECKPEMALLQ